MKLISSALSVFSIFILCSASAFGRDVILIENKGTIEDAQIVIKILQEKFNIPRKLITLKNITSECSKASDAIMQLCVKADGEMDIVKVNKFVVENTLRVFLEKEEI